MCPSGRNSCPLERSAEINHGINNGRLYESAGITLFAIGGTALAAGAALLLFGPKALGAAYLAPQAYPHGGGGTVGASF
jgi:hypothetical protein